MGYNVKQSRASRYIDYIRRNVSLFSWHELRVQSGTYENEMPGRGSLPPTTAGFDGDLHLRPGIIGGKDFRAKIVLGGILLWGFVIVLVELINPLLLTLGTNFLWLSLVEVVVLEILSTFVRVFLCRF